jgi:hypothetical protein
MTLHDMSHALQVDVETIREAELHRRRSMHGQEKGQNAVCNRCRGEES